MSLFLQIIVIYIKENIITKLQKLYSQPRNSRTSNKSPTLFVKKPCCKALKGLQHILKLSCRSIASFTQLIFVVWQVEGYQHILKLSYRPPAFTSYKALLKNKKRSGTSLSASFCAWFLKKSISAMFYWLTKFCCLVAFALWDIGQCMYCNCLLTRLRHQKFWN